MDTGLVYLRYWMAISAGMYFIAMLFFLFGQNLLLEQMNTISKKLFKDRFPPIPLSSEKFWLVLTTSMMLMLVALCGFVAYNPGAFLEMTIIVLISKACSTSLYVALFAREKYFAHLVGALTDGPLFLITLLIYLQAI
jgi:hypothetical protein